MGKIKTSISIEENVSSAFKSMNTVVSSTLGTFKNLDNVINDTPTMDDNNATILNSISNASNSASNALNNTSSAVNSMNALDNSNVSTLNAMYTGANNTTHSFENMNSSINSVGTVNDSSVSVLNSITTKANDATNSIDTTNNSINSMRTISDDNVSTLNAMYTGANNVNASMGSMNNSIASINEIDSSNASNLKVISTEGNNATKSIENVNGAISSMENINDTNVVALNSISAGANSARNSLEGVNNSINTANVSSNINYWTDAVGNYDKSASEAIYTTEELVEMGFKTVDALNEQESSVNQVDNAVSTLKNNVMQWSSMPNIELFNSTGIQRYNQEINSAQTLMNQLIQRQTAIQNQAKNTNILSSTAQSDLDNLSVRLERLQTAMQELEKKKISSVGADEASAEVEELREKINNALKSQNDLNSAMQNMNPSEAYSAYSELKNNIKEAESEVNNLNDSLDNMDTKINTANNSSGSLLSTLLGFSAVQSIFNLVTNQLDSAIDRMDTMTNYSRTMTAITGSSEAAELSLEELNTAVKGTAYGLDTAAAATQNFVTRGMGIATATSEVSKWADAVAFYGEGTNEQLESVTDALGKMLSKGTVSMEYLNTLTDAGINAVGIYAQATGQSSSVVQDALSAGEISAYDFITTVSTAFEEGTNGVLNISGAAKEAGATWTTSIANMKAAVTRGLVSMIDSINNALTNAGFGTILTGITNFGTTMETVLGNIGNAIGGVITLLSPILNLIQQVASVISDNWSWISPIILGIVAALAIYYAYTALVSTATKIWSAIQTVFNAIMAANPIVLIIMAIIILIGIIYAVVSAVNNATGSTTSAIGVIVRSSDGSSCIYMEFIFSSFRLSFGHNKRNGKPLDCFRKLFWKFI